MSGRHARSGGFPGGEQYGAPMPPTFANGKICYIEMPATDVARSADFYKRVFGWNIGNAVMVARPLTTRSAQ
jgi:hypothetical protein